MIAAAIAKLKTNTPLLLGASHSVQGEPSQTKVNHGNSAVIKAIDYDCRNALALDNVVSVRLQKGCARLKKMKNRCCSYMLRWTFDSGGDLCCYECDTAAVDVSAITGDVSDQVRILQAN